MNENKEKLVIRTKNIRKSILDMAFTAGASSAHFGGALSIVELITCLFFNKMKIDKQNSNWEERDCFILSKGHGCLAYYATLAEIAIYLKKN